MEIFNFELSLLICTSKVVQMRMKFEETRSLSIHLEKERNSFLQSSSGIYWPVALTGLQTLPRRGAQQPRQGVLANPDTPLAPPLETLPPSHRSPFNGVVIAVESSCPDEEDIEPCTCQEESGKSILRCKNIPGISVLEKVAENSDGYRYDESAMQLEFPSQPKPSGTPDGAAQVGTWRERNLLNRRVAKLLRCKRNYTMKPLQTI
ncbi:hypothetical protein AVEN_71859-1 [Araneus ventricosus]|uniref:Uncharacterized protein n=1 Tax=Araneus ventricosus TaxID=182803 RepID=A0A4Y2UMV5_ARAVE|nr:hypothetical protein AVEN_151134-1 [Araneus ventricosus]GBO14872.1 hypothetical protein AVEN_71859-1 [Araneus ventricosus]